MPEADRRRPGIPQAQGQVEANHSPLARVDPDPEGAPDTAEGRAPKGRGLWEENDLVFAQENGRPIDPRDDWDDWKALLAAGVRDARVHDGRHTAGRS